MKQPSTSGVLAMCALSHAAVHPRSSLLSMCPHARLLDSGSAGMHPRRTLDAAAALAWRDHAPRARAGCCVPRVRDGTGARKSAWAHAAAAAACTPQPSHAVLSLCPNVRAALQEFYFNLSHSLPSGMPEFVLLFVLSLLDVTFIFWIFKVRGCSAAASAARRRSVLRYGAGAGTQVQGGDKVHVQERAQPLGLEARRLGEPIESEIVSARRFETQNVAEKRGSTG